jgi:20S proteasome alpha/beta subunit
MRVKFILILCTVEYAIEAIKVRTLFMKRCGSQHDATNTLHQLGSTTVGIRTQGGVVLAVEKRVQSPLLESSSIEKIMEIDSHLGCAMSG